MKLTPTNLPLKPSRPAKDSPPTLTCSSRDPARLASFEFHERWVRGLTGRLRKISLPNGRVDLVIRPASTDSSPGYGLTLYAAGCGADATTAYASWEAVLRAAVTATINLDSSASLTGE